MENLWEYCNVQSEIKNLSESKCGIGMKVYSKLLLNYKLFQTRRTLYWIEIILSEYFFVFNKPYLRRNGVFILEEEYSDRS